MTYDAEAIIDYDYAAHKDQYRMLLNERASIFWPFMALAGFEEEIQKVIDLINITERERLKASPSFFIRY